MRGRMAWSIGLLTAFGVLAGCGVTSNPRRLPFLIPPGDVTQTHAKPGGFEATSPTSTPRPSASRSAPATSRCP